MVAASPARPRDPAIDLLRGYFLFIIVVDHLRYAQNLLYPLTGHFRLFVTAAEGFVLVSGFLVGKLRGGEARARGLREPGRRLLRRAAMLAAWSIGITLVLRAISQATGYFPPVEVKLARDHLPWWLSALLLQYGFGDHSLLPAYALYLALAPAAIYLLLRGRALALLAASLALWAAAFVTRVQLFATYQADLSYQVLFVIGMCAGFHEAAVARVWERRGVVLAAGLFTAATMALSWLRLDAEGELHTHLEQLLFERRFLGPGRLGCALVWIGFFFAIARRYREPLARTIGKFLIPFGKNSLYVYIVQAILAYALLAWAPPNVWVATAITIADLGLIWLLVTRRVLFAVIPR